METITSILLAAAIAVAGFVVCSFLIRLLDRWETEKWERRLQNGAC